MKTILDTPLLYILYTYLLIHSTCVHVILVMKQIWMICKLLLLYLQ